MISRFFEISIGLRYLRAQQRHGFISLISLIPILCICLGVAALIIVLSAMNGFQKDIRAMILSTTPHVELTGYAEPLSDWRKIAQKAVTERHVMAAAPFMETQALLSFNGDSRGMLVRGIDAKQEATVSSIEQKLVAGKLQDLVPGKYNIILGARLAENLNIRLGDKITLITPNGNITPAGMMPRMKQFTVVGFFRFGLPEYDAMNAVIALRDAQVILRTGEDVSGIRLKLDDAMLAPYWSEEMINRHSFDDHIRISNWADMNSSYFRAVQIEKRMMYIILTIIVVVASFNLISTLVMAVTDKRSDIAILRTLGARPFSITCIFLIQGAVAGLSGVITGVLSGVLVAKNLDVIYPLIERVLGTKILNSQVYMIDYLPSDVQMNDVLTVTLIALTLSLLATIYPSVRAARTQPAEALRYE